MDKLPHPWLRRGRIKPPARLDLPAQQCTSLQYAPVLWAVLSIHGPAHYVYDVLCEQNTHCNGHRRGVGHAEAVQVAHFFSYIGSFQCVINFRPLNNTGQHICAMGRTKLLLWLPR